jgi:hypothetical protein
VARRNPVNCASSSAAMSLPDLNVKNRHVFMPYTKALGG